MSEDKFKQLAEISRLLNTESDSVTELIEEFEKKLQALSLGIEVWLEGSPLHEENREGSLRDSEHRETWLGYARLEDQWALAVKDVRVCEGQYQGDESAPYRDICDAADPRPLRKAARNLRIEAVARFDLLLNELQTKAEKMLSELQKAKSMMGQLGGSGPGGPSKGEVGAKVKTKTQQTAPFYLGLPVLDESILGAVPRLDEIALHLDSPSLKALTDGVAAIAASPLSRSMAELTEDAERFARQIEGIMLPDIKSLDIPSLSALTDGVAAIATSPSFRSSMMELQEEAERIARQFQGIKLPEIKFPN